MDEKFKMDHYLRPIIIMRIDEPLTEQQFRSNRNNDTQSKKYEIILEKFHRDAAAAEETLIQFAEPSSTTTNIQTFIITFYSLYTAMTLGWNEERIKNEIDRLAKNERIPKDITDFIEKNTQYFNRAYFYLEKESYYIDIEKKLLEELKQRNFGQMNNLTTIENYERLDGNLNERKTFVKFKIKTNEHFSVNKELVEDFNVPVKQEFDYLKDLENTKQDTQKKLQQFRMKAIYQLYSHQNRALKKIFQNDKAHSGVIILPCGAGKTLLGINVALKIKRKTLIICDQVNDVFQWQKSFLKFTEMDKNNIAIILRTQQELPTVLLGREHIIVITNKDMISSNRKDIKLVTTLEWPLLIMDEVHGLPAAQINAEISKLKANMKIGLTATPYRQDNKIKEIFYKVGPKLHESMIVDLKQMGYVSKIYCIQIYVGMQDQYKQKYEEYKRVNNQFVMNTLYQMNPKKFEVLQNLILIHRARKDKILVFCEKVNKLADTGTLEKFAKLNNCPIISQKVEQTERSAIYKLYQEDKLDVIIFGQIADQGLDLPSANVGIQISFNFKSVRQEFQRMGRIQRRKENQIGEYDCFFYSIVTKGTKEVEIQFDRQIAVINQGYPYEIISAEELKPPQQDPDKKQQLEKILDEMQKKVLETCTKRGEDDREEDGY
ncbi:unnamed protein product [Paramecium sonneborni]|uniref:DNA 3'-5' helicase n=1 Tax=Paramecium sonneborni TaxID=65129 RepID=A0A8S1KNI8_9CILI|nr:unnamed protein product [Paramecium sonneborni]